MYKFSNGDKVKLNYDNLSGIVVGKTVVKKEMELVIVELEEPIFYRDITVSTSMILVHPSNLEHIKN